MFKLYRNNVDNLLDILKTHRILLVILFYFVKTTGLDIGNILLIAIVILTYYIEKLKTTY
jgi:hypothetical protein